ncbi:serine--tRNA ligase [Candidatus Saccharibacteria bacterium CPR2]|nr:serine--tRNA ligase [Candidatus Saccharibacteria bacterium CPR2]
MLDIQFIRENKELVKKAANNKNIDVDIERLLQIDEKRREKIAAIENLRSQRKDIASKIKSSKPDSGLVEQGKALKTQVAHLEDEFSKIELDYLELLKQIPNIPSQDVPVGKSEDDNQVAKEWGIKPEFSFEPKNHWEIAKARGWIDKERAAKVTGARFAYLKGDLVKLQWAMMQFAVDILTDEESLRKIAQENNLKIATKPFLPILPPLMIKTDVYDAMDRLEPKDDRYKIEGEDLWLQGSAEHVLGSMHFDEILEESQLPLRYLGYATSFRKEAGTYGKDTEGIIRMHQFDKLEMESLTTAEASWDEHLFMIAIQEHLMQALELPYRVVMKCTADIGKPNARGVDIDVWLPGQNNYRETHTADYMTDYQSRRLKTRVRKEDGIELVHTNDATVFSQRPLIAIIENNQTEDMRVRVPKALQKYMHRKEQI